MIGTIINTCLSDYSKSNNDLSQLELQNSKGDLIQAEDWTSLIEDASNAMLSISVKFLEQPINVMAHVEHLDPETLDEYGLPWEYNSVAMTEHFLSYILQLILFQKDPSYINIKQWIPEEDQDLLFEHTRLLREHREKTVKQPLIRSGARVATQADDLEFEKTPRESRSYRTNINNGIAPGYSANGRETFVVEKEHSPSVRRHEHTASQEFQILNDVKASEEDLSLMARRSRGNELSDYDASHGPLQENNRSPTPSINGAFIRGSNNDTLKMSRGSARISRDVEQLHSVSNRTIKNTLPNENRDIFYTSRAFETAETKSTIPNLATDSPKEKSNISGRQQTFVKLKQEFETNCDNEGKKIS